MIFGQNYIMNIPRFSNKWLSVLTFSVFAFFVPKSTEAQIWKDAGNKLKKKLENQASQRLERQIDNTINKSLDKAENAATDAVKGGEKKSSESENPYGNMSSPFGKSDVKMSEEYNFQLGISYNLEISGSKKKEKVPATTMWFGKEEYMGMSTEQEKNVFMVLDQGAMITFMEKEKMYMVIGGSTAILEQAIAEEGEEDLVDYTFEKIGSEKIIGYDCEIYEVKTEDNQVRVWLTEDLKIEAGHFMKAFSVIAKNTNSNTLNLNPKTGGIMLRMVSTDIKSNETMTMQATEVHNKGKNIITGEYKSFGF